MITPEKEAILSQESTALAAEITDAVNRNLPNEKAVLISQLRKTAHEIKSLKLAPTTGEGRGQPCLSIPPIAYQRWNLIYPGCFHNKEFCDEWAIDNTDCVFPGYTPKAKPVYFDMGRKVSPVSFGADTYHKYKDKVNAEIARETAAMAAQIASMPRS